MVSRHILPRVAVVDPELMVTTPPRVTAFTGIDALGHALESFWSKKANFLSEMYALQTIKLVPEYLPRAVRDGTDMDAREHMALAALCGGVALIAGAGGIAATSYPVEGHFDVAHGLGNGIMMPHIVRYNAPMDMSKTKKVAEQFGIHVQGVGDDQVIDLLVEKISHLIQEVGLAVRLRDVGVTEADIPKLAEEAAQNTRLLECNPREMDVKAIEQIYRSAL